MKAPGKHFVSKRVITNEILAFTFIILFIWVDEVMDIPYLLFGAEATPINWRESLSESVIVAFTAVIIVSYTHKIFKRMKYLEGFLSICASCKKIRDKKGNWHPIESYIHARTEAKFSHGVCPECAEKLYPEFNPYKND